jgi:hypothetical protein
MCICDSKKTKTVPESMRFSKTDKVLYASPRPRPLYPLNGVFFVFFNILFRFQFRDCEENTLQLYCVPNSEKSRSYIRMSTRLA